VGTPSVKLSDCSRKVIARGAARTEEFFGFFEHHRLNMACPDGKVVLRPTSRPPIATVKLELVREQLAPPLREFVKFC
jgi:hypothetical protein